MQQEQKTDPICMHTVTISCKLVIVWTQFCVRFLTLLRRFIVLRMEVDRENKELKIAQNCKFMRESSSGKIDARCRPTRRIRQTTRTSGIRRSARIASSRILSTRDFGRRTFIAMIAIETFWEMRLL